MTKLATIEKINRLSPIPNSDNLLLADVLGYQLVVKKDDFQSGDLCVFHHLDTIVDKDNPVYNFLKSRDFRIRTIRLRKQLSQGLAMPLSVFNLSSDLPEGTDVAEQIKIRKFEKEIPAQLRGQIEGLFPSFLSKTDEPNLQSHPEIFEAMLALVEDGEEFMATLKYDGSSLTAYLNDGKFGVCSRNYELKETEDNAYWQAARKYKLEKSLRDYTEMCGINGSNIAIQGEMYGPGIQGNPHGVKELSFAAFNFIDIGTGEKISLTDVDDFSMFPSVMKLDLPCDKSMSSLLDFADTLKYENGSQAEGLVLRIGNLSGKILSRKYDEA